jgi:Uma2 family endonuclease
MAISPTRSRRWTRREYERLIDAGVFRPGERLELLARHLVVSEPPGSLHATAIGLVEDALRACFGSGWHVRVQMPIALDDESEPEPDVAVVAGGRRDYELARPEGPALLVEVSESSLDDDRGAKAALYARAAVAEYWIVNPCGPFPEGTSRAAADGKRASRLELQGRHGSGTWRVSQSTGVSDSSDPGRRSSPARAIHALGDSEGGFTSLPNLPRGAAPAKPALEADQPLRTGCFNRLPPIPSDRLLACVLSASRRAELRPAELLPQVVSDLHRARQALRDCLGEGDERMDLPGILAIGHVHPGGA